MCDRLLRLRNVLTVMHLEGDIRLSLTEDCCTRSYNSVKAIYGSTKIAEG